MFRNREDAGKRLAARLLDRPMIDPLVLGVPRGGVVTAAALAQELGAELDVVLARKLRAPDQPEVAIGAIGETGEEFLNDFAYDLPGVTEHYLNLERRHQREEIARRRLLFRGGRPPASVTGRTVLVVDDGIATGATMTAALQTLRGREPREVIVAVPVAAPGRLAEVARWADDAVCLLQPRDFWAVGSFYEDFTQVEDDEVLALLRRRPVAVPNTAEG